MVRQQPVGRLSCILMIILCMTAVFPILNCSTDRAFAFASPEYQFSLGEPFTTSSTSSPSRADVLAGTLSVAVILVNFPDKTNVKSRADIITLIFTDVNEYWKEVSYGRISLKGATTNKWYTLQNTMAYYGADPETSSKRLALINEAVSAADSELNFKDYKYVIIVHAGDDQAKSGKSSDLWSFGSIGSFNIQTNDGALSLAVSIVSELDPVGPVAHEMGHNFGLVDLWDYKADLSKGYPSGGEPFVGEWDLMAHGLWAGNGNNPTHLSAYSKIKLGWIPDTQIQNVGIEANTAITLQPLASGKGTLTARIPLTKTTYYLVEVRKRIGRDSHIPMEGVLVYYIDETKGNGEGPARIRSRTPPYPDTGAWRTGDVYSHQETGFRLVIMQSSDTGFGVAFGTAAQPPATSFTIKIQAPYPGLSVILDGKTFTTDSTGSVSIPDVAAGQHTISIQSGVSVSAGIRRGFVRWSDGSTANPRVIALTSALTLTAIYKTQYQLTVTSKYGNITGAGWHEENSTVTVVVNQGSSTPTIVDHGNGTRRMFAGWSGDLTGAETTKTVTMSGPKTAVVNWTTQYRLQVVSTYGNPQGTGWYAVGTSVAFSVTSPFPIGDATRQLLQSWTGDYAGSSASGTILIDRPKNITANWKTQYLVTIQFQDAKGVNLATSPSKVALASPNSTATALTQYSNVWLDEGTWVLKQVIWHGVDVKKSELSYNPRPRDTWRIQVRAYSLTVKVTSTLTGWAVSGATVAVTLADNAVLSNSTNNQGVVIFAQLPAWDGYSLSVSAQGMNTRSDLKLSDATTKSVSLILLTDILLIVGIIGGVVGLVLLIRRKRLSSEEPSPMESLPPLISSTGSEPSLLEEPAVSPDESKSAESLTEWLESELEKEPN